MLSYSLACPNWLLYHVKRAPLKPRSIIPELLTKLLNEITDFSNFFKRFTTPLLITRKDDIEVTHYHKWMARGNTSVHHVLEFPPLSARRACMDQSPVLDEGLAAASFGHPGSAVPPMVDAGQTANQIISRSNLATSSSRSTKRLSIRFIN